MSTSRAKWWALAGLTWATISAPPLPAAEVRLTADDPAGALTAALAAAASGDHIRVEGGHWAGPFVIDRPLTLSGHDWPVLDGGGAGTVVTVRAAGVTVGGFTIRGSGASLDAENSGLAIEAADATIEGNRLDDVLFGIYLRQAPGSRIAANRIRGKALAVPRRGDAIRVWHSNGVTLADNDVAGSRDVVLWYSSDLAVRGNRIQGGRYGLHFMYCDDAVIEGNLLAMNSVGAFLMYSRRLRLRGNTLAGNHGPSGYGIGLKDMDDAEVRDNLFAGNRVGAMLDNSPRESTSRSSLTGNLFAGNDVGVFLLPNVRRAELGGNGFLDNGEQVAIGGGSDPEANRWSGNYWSDYAGYDADADGIGDLPYRAERLFEDLSDRRPELRLFRHSPAAGALDFAARAFPAVKPAPKLTDASPRLRPPAPPETPVFHRSEGRWAPAAAGMLSGALLLLALPLQRPARRRPAAPVAAPRPAGPETVIQAVGLTKLYSGKPALLGVDFTIGRGESIALWGPNGAGKTTALKVLLGMVRFSGSVRVLGQDPRRQAKTVRRSIGYLPQEPGFEAEPTVEETLAFYAALRRVTAERIEKLLPLLGLAEHRDKPAGALSGGLRQRLALGVALLADPPILLLDEPTANLDPAARGVLLDLLLELKRAGKTLIFTSHRVDEVRILADRVLHLVDGRLAAAGPIDELTLEGTAELRLRVDPGHVEAACRALAPAHPEIRRLGPYLALEVAADRKAEPLGRLAAAGIEVRDFEVVPPIESGAHRG